MLFIKASAQFTPVVVGGEPWSERGAGLSDIARTSSPRLARFFTLFLFIGIFVNIIIFLSSILMCKRVYDEK